MDHLENCSNQSLVFQSGGSSIIVRMRIVTFLFYSVLLFLGSRALAVNINQLNGSINIVYVDFSVPGYAVPLELVRSYNSITALNETTGWSGVFGWGWTSPLETTLTVTPEKAVILRDGGTGNNIIFRPDQTDEKALESFYQSVKKAYFEQQKNRKLSASELSQLELPEKMMSRMKTDLSFRNEIASRFKINITPSSDLLTSSDYGYQTLQYKNKQWIREKDGITQLFDKDGRLIRQVDKNGFYFEYIYSDSNKFQLSEIHDQDRVTSLKLTWKGDRVVSALDNRGRKATYQYDGLGNLSQVVDSNQQTYQFKYENKKFPHLLTQIEFVSENKNKGPVTRSFKYDEAGLVAYHRDKEGHEVLYQYGRNASDPDNNFWTKISTKSPSGNTETFQEFLLKDRQDGSKYLYKQDTKESGTVSSTLFSSCCGKPLQITKNGEVTYFKYTEDGLLKERTSPQEELKIEYEPKWKKISKVFQNGITSQYEYDSRGNLVKASNSKNQKVSLMYDKYGRIVEMTDQGQTRLSFKYGTLGKPVVISNKLIGTIKISYDPDGRILKTETELQHARNRRPTQEESQEVIRRVLGEFQNLLDIIRPAGIGLSSET